MSLFTLAQDYVRVGARCWVLHPGSGIKPVAEGIAGGAPSRHKAGDGSGLTFLEELCEDGQQMVTVTKIYKKNTELMYIEDDTISKYLDDYVTPPAHPDTIVRWKSRYLAEKEDDG